MAAGISGQADPWVGFKQEWRPFLDAHRVGWQSDPALEHGTSAAFYLSAKNGTGRLVNSVQESSSV